MQGNLQQAIQYASQNPTSDFAKQLGQHIASGGADEQAKQLGIDLTPIKQKYAPPVQTPQTQPVQSQTQDYGLAGKVAGGIANSLNQRGQNIVSDISNVPANAQAAGGGPLAYAAAGGQALGHVAGNIAGGAGDIIGNLISPFLPEGVKQGIGNFSQTINQKIDQIPGMTPELHKSIVDVFNTVSLLGGAKAEPGVITGAEKVGQVAGDVAKNAKETFGQIPGNIKEAFVPSLTPEEAVGKVVQGTPNDIKAAKNTLSSIDTSSVKTYSDLQSKLKDEIKTLSKAQDTFLSSENKVYKIQQLATDVGDIKNAHNYVNDALGQLKEYYTKTNDIKNLQKVDGLLKKVDPIKGKGLSLQEVNEIARLHGSDLNGFNANGELASGLTKKAAENTRMGLKNTIRNLLPNDISKGIDAKISDAYDTKALIDKMVKAVNKTAQKTTKQGEISKVIQKGVRPIKNAIDNPVSTIGNLGSPTGLSPLDLENSLPKFLKAIRGK